MCKIGIPTLKSVSLIGIIFTALSVVPSVAEPDIGDSDTVRELDKISYCPPVLFQKCGGGGAILATEHNGYCKEPPNVPCP